MRKKIIRVGLFVSLVLIRMLPLFAYAWSFIAHASSIPTVHADGGDGGDGGDPGLGGDTAWGGDNGWGGDGGGDNTDQQAQQQKYQDCIDNNPNQETYCQCISKGGVGLNTDVPFIGRCINKTGTDGTGATSSTVFNDLIGGLSKIVVTAILILGFIMIIIGGIMRSTGNAKKGKDMITKVAIGLALLGAAGAILHLINPNFFI